MYRIILSLLCFSISTTIIFDVQGKELFVDYVSGNDSNSGTARNQPWKHAPGDEKAEARAGIYDLEPGDQVIFKGGIRYRGSITISESGDDKNRISYRGDLWGEQRAIIDGAVSVGIKFGPCPSKVECYNNEHWEQLWVSSFEELDDPFTPMFILNDRYWPAQSPNLSDPFWFDDIKSYFVVPKGNTIVRLSSDSLSLTKKDMDIDPQEWASSWLAAWLKPNKIIVSEITRVDVENRVVHFHQQKHKPYIKRDAYYSFFNRPMDLDRVGEFFVDNQKKKILVWPKKPQFMADVLSLELSHRARAFDLNGQSNILVEGFRIQNFFGRLKEWRSGAAILNIKKSSKKITIRNNIIENLRSAVGIGAIQLKHVHEALIENNIILNSQKNSGIRVAESNDVVIKNNVIRKIGRTGIRLIGNSNILVVGNQLSEIKGVHGNGMSVYLKNTNILIADNTIFNTPSALTYHGSRKPGEAYNLWILNNILLGRVNSWGKHMSRIFILHNLFLDTEERGKALQVPDKDRALVAANNIIDGWLVKKYPFDWEVRRNLYSELAWPQRSKYGWKMEDGGELMPGLYSQVVSSLINGEKNMMEMGVNISAYLPIDIFPDYDFGVWSESRSVGPRNIPKIENWREK